MSDNNVNGINSNSESGFIEEVNEINNDYIEVNEKFFSKREKKNKKEEKEERANFINDWVVPIIIAFILAALIQRFVVFKVKIPSESMVPTLNVEDSLFVTRVYNPEKLERGDVVVFYSQERDEDMIKRLIGLPGDEVVIDKGVVTVNGITLEENYIGEQDEFIGTYNVPEDKYFFLGDNRLWSLDSRYWENPYIDESDITGKAQLKVYPFDDFGWIK